MNKSFKFTAKIINGEKRIESRWYKNKYAPWNKITSGDIIYFKETGNQLAAKAIVRKVKQFKDLNTVKINKILDKYYKEIGIDKKELNKFKNRFKDKKYCTLIFLEQPEQIKPFYFDKRGYGNMTSLGFHYHIKCIRFRYYLKISIKTF